MASYYNFRIISGVFRRDPGVTAGFPGCFSHHREQKEKQSKFEPLKGVITSLLYSAHPNLVGLPQSAKFSYVSVMSKVF